MEDIVTTRFDYGRLDEPDSPIRIRLNSTAVRVHHVDDRLDNAVRVTYLRDGEAQTVSAGRVIMAGFHAMIPSLCPEMPQVQREALSGALRAPLVYSNVLIRNWTSFAKLGLRRAYCPGSYHTDVTLDFPVSQLVVRDQRHGRKVITIGRRLQFPLVVWRRTQSAEPIFRETT